MFLIYSKLYRQEWGGYNLKTLKNKALWQGLAILAISIVSAILLFFPEAIENRYPYSYKRIIDEQSNVNSSNDRLSSNENAIKSSIDNVDRLEWEKESYSEEEFVVRKGIVEEDFEFHIPSLLISLEQNAIENKVDIEIDYASMATTPSDGGAPENYNPDGSVSQASQETSEVPTKEKDSVDSEVATDESTESTSGSSEEEVAANESKSSEDITVTEQEVTKEETTPVAEDGSGNSKEVVVEGETGYIAQSTEIPVIEGINVTTIPISISGTFYNVRNYIKYLDEVGMIEPSSVVITSEGRTVTSSIIINIFHGEVN